MKQEWNPTIRGKEVWYKNPIRDKNLVIRFVNLIDNKHGYQGEYQYSSTQTWEWRGKTHNEVLDKAIKDIETRED